jgi:hypothetical protein
MTAYWIFQRSSPMAAPGRLRKLDELPLSTPSRPMNVPRAAIAVRKSGRFSV